MADNTNTTITFRLSPGLLSAIDERVSDVNEQGDGRLSRNEWLDKCVRWSLRNLPYGMTTEEIKEAHASSEFAAPLDVSGTYQMRMTAIEERRIPDDQPRHFHRFTKMDPNPIDTQHGMPRYRFACECGAIKEDYR